MANILVTYSAAVIDGQVVDTCFYEGFIKKLCEAGNNIMRLRTNDLIHSSWNGCNDISKIINIENLYASIKLFKPDIVFTFNFSIPSGLDTLLDCPIVVMEADRFIYYNDKDYLRKNSHRFYFLNTTPETLENTFHEVGSPSNFKGDVVPFATAVEAEEMEQDKNISFIGSVFTTSSAIHKNLLQYEGNNFLSTLSKDEQIMVDSARDRIRVLDSLASLGLHIYGNPDWLELRWVLLSLAACYNKGRIYSLKDNQKVYNSSIICLNNTHKQSLGGYSFRVMDIMASNGCLLTDRSSGIKALTKHYVDIPEYTDDQSAYNQAKKLLNDKRWREEIVAGSQACIRERGNWIDRFKQVSILTKVELINPDVTGTINWVDNESYHKSSTSLLFSLQSQAVKIVPTCLHKICYQILQSVKVPISNSAMKSALNKKLMK